MEKHLFSLHTSLLELAFLPKDWRVAKISDKAKSKKKSHTLPNKYYPISLIPTISQGLEVIIASRMLFLAEIHNFFSENHFKACKRLLWEQIVNMLIEKIYNS